MQTATNGLSREHFYAGRMPSVSEVVLAMYASGARPDREKRPLLPFAPTPIDLPLKVAIGELDHFPIAHSFGADIDDTNKTLLSDEISPDEKQIALREWLARYQPCLFGRLAAKGHKGLGTDICWIDQSDLHQGELAIATKIQRARREWKDRAALGLSHGFLIMFNLRGLAHAKPSPQLIQVCQRIANLYLVESAPVALDTIYTEAMPLKNSSEWYLYKAGINIFYSGAHRTLNHDRRVPGGLLLSVNSPGHFANSLVVRGLSETLEEAVTIVFELALRSIGNGGIGDDRALSTSWHRGFDPGRRCPILRSDDPIRKSETRYYSASYHTDVLLPSVVTCDSTLDPRAEKCEIWPWLIIDYISADTHPPSHVNYALFHGHPISEEARYFNPWPPRLAVNRPLKDY